MKKTGKQNQRKRQLLASGDRRGNRRCGIIVLEKDIDKAKKGKSDDF